MPGPLAGVRVERVEGIPSVAVRIWLPGGSRASSVPGLALLAGRLLAEGTARRDWRAISRDAEQRGAVVWTAAGQSVQAIAIDALSRDLESAIDWAWELLIEPTFPEDRFEWLRRQTLAELESLADLPDVVTGWAFLEQLYGDHPLGRPLQGSVEGLTSLTAHQCAQFHRKQLGLGPLIAITGDVDRSSVVSRLERLGALRTCTPASPSRLSDPTRPTRKRRNVELRRGEQAHVMVGTLTVRRADPDYEALQILGIVLGAGAGLVGRVPQRVREAEGMAYSCSVETVAGAGVDRGRLAVAVGTADEDAERALSLIGEELEDLRLRGPLHEEVESARAYLIGSEPFRRETARQRALLELESMLWSLPVEDVSWVRRRLEAVTTDDVCRVARRFLDPGRLVQTVGRPC